MKTCCKMCGAEFKYFQTHPEKHDTPDFCTACIQIKHSNGVIGQQLPIPARDEVTFKRFWFGDGSIKRVKIPKNTKGRVVWTIDDAWFEPDGEKK